MNQHVTEVSDSSFEKDVLQSDKPVLVDFWAAWCAPCRMLAPTVDAVAEKYASTAVVVVFRSPQKAEAVRQGFENTLREDQTALLGLRCENFED